METSSERVGELWRQSLLERIRDVPDFPRPGIVFKDITPLLSDPWCLDTVVDYLAELAYDPVDYEPRFDKVAGIEARGFILGAPVARHLSLGFVPVRKAGKLPGATHRVSYALEYGEATLEVHRDAFGPGDRVLVVDDVLATGGTAAATCALVEACGATVVGVAVLLELSFLPGREALAGVPVTSILTV